MGRGVGRGPRPSYDDDGRGEDGTGKKGEGGRPHGVAIDDVGAALGASV